MQNIYFVRKLEKRSDKVIFLFSQGTKFHTSNQQKFKLKDMAMAAKAFVRGYETGKKKNGIYLYYASICFEDSGDSKNALKYAVSLTRKYPLEPKWWKALASLYLKNNDLKHGLAALVSYGFLTPLKNNEILLATDLYLSLNIPSMQQLFIMKSCCMEK